MARTAAPSATFENAQLGMRACRSVQPPAEGHASCVRDCHRSLLRRVSSSSPCRGLSSLIFCRPGRKEMTPHAAAGRKHARPAISLSGALRSCSGPGAWCLSLSLHISTNRVAVLLRRNQLRATRDRVESYRIVSVDSPLDSPASPLQLSVSAAS